MDHHPSRPANRNAPRRQALVVRLATIAVGSCFALTAATAGASIPARSSDLNSRPVEVAQATGAQVVLKWQARSQSTDGQWRVYRSVDGREFTLADTIDVSKGIQNYHFSDLRLRANLPTQVYQLRYFGQDGKETVVAVARCTDSGMEDNPVTPSFQHYPQADLVFVDLIRPTLTQAFLSAQFIGAWEWTPQPEFPPPRAA